VAHEWVIVHLFCQCQQSDLNNDAGQWTTSRPYVPFNDVMPVVKGQPTASVSATAVFHIDSLCSVNLVNKRLLTVRSYYKRTNKPVMSLATGGALFH